MSTSEAAAAAVATPVQLNFLIAGGQTDSSLTKQFLTLDLSSTTLGQLRQQSLQLLQEQDASVLRVRLLAKGQVLSEDQDMLTLFAVLPSASVVNVHVVGVRTATVTSSLPMSENHGNKESMENKLSNSPEVMVVNEQSFRPNMAEANDERPPVLGTFTTDLIDVVPLLVHQNQTYFAPAYRVNYNRQLSWSVRPICKASINGKWFTVHAMRLRRQSDSEQVQMLLQNLGYSVALPSNVLPAENTTPLVIPIWTRIRNGFSAIIALPWDAMLRVTIFMLIALSQMGLERFVAVALLVGLCMTLHRNLLLLKALLEQRRRVQAEVTNNAPAVAQNGENRHPVVRGWVAVRNVVVPLIMTLLPDVQVPAALLHRPPRAEPPAVPAPNEAQAVRNHQGFAM